MNITKERRSGNGNDSSKYQEKDNNDENMTTKQKVDASVKKVLKRRKKLIRDLAEEKRD